jgi:hypothetical protein
MQIKQEDCSRSDGAAADSYYHHHKDRNMRGLGAFSTIILGAVLFGVIGFVGGFFGPMIFTPEANQGPLLGIFITGPAGVMVGGIIGLVYWIKKDRS